MCFSERLRQPKIAVDHPGRAGAGVAQGGFDEYASVFLGLVTQTAGMAGGGYPGSGPFGAAARAGNVRGWVRNVAGGGHATRGGAWKEPCYAFSGTPSQRSFARLDTLGFRCMLSADPEPERLASPIESNILDLTSIEFMPDAAFAVYQDLAAYEDVPLNPRVEQKAESGESSIHEIVTIDAGHD